MNGVYNRSRGVIGLTVAGVLVSGCGAMRGQETRGPQEPVLEEPSAAPAPEPVQAPSVRTLPERRPPRAARPAPRPAKPVVPAPVVSLAGLSEDDVRRIMGEPQSRTERSGRRIWTYRGVGCHVEVTFFRDVTRGAYAALSHRVVQANGAADDVCLRDASHDVR